MDALDCHHVGGSKLEEDKDALLASYLVSLVNNQVKIISYIYANVMEVYRDSCLKLKDAKGYT